MLRPKASHLVERVAERLLWSGALDNAATQLLQPSASPTPDAAEPMAEAVPEEPRRSSLFVPREPTPIAPEWPATSGAVASAVGRTGRTAAFKSCRSRRSRVFTGGSWTGIPPADAAASGSGYGADYVRRAATSGPRCHATDPRPCARRRYGDQRPAAIPHRRRGFAGAGRHGRLVTHPHPHLRGVQAGAAPDPALRLWPRRGTWLLQLADGHQRAPR